MRARFRLGLAIHKEITERSPEMPKPIFVFSEYFRGLNQSGLTGGTITLYEAVLALAKIFDVRVFSFDPDGGSNDLGELSHCTTYLLPPKVGGVRLAAIWNQMLRTAYDNAVACHGTPAAVVAASDALPLLAFEETRHVKRVAIIQAYENFGVFVPRGSFGDRLNGLKRSLKSRLLFKRAIVNADRIIVNSNYVGRAVESRFGTTSISVIYPPLSSLFTEFSGSLKRFISPIGWVRQSNGGQEFALRLFFGGVDAGCDIQGFRIC